MDGCLYRGRISQRPSRVAIKHRSSGQSRVCPTPQLTSVPEHESASVSSAVCSQTLRCCEICSLRLAAAVLFGRRYLVITVGSCWNSSSPYWPLSASPSAVEAISPSKSSPFRSSSPCSNADVSSAKTLFRRMREHLVTS